jgi:hypothetical protein
MPVIAEGPKPAIVNHEPMDSHFAPHSPWSTSQCFRTASAYVSRLSTSASKAIWFSSVSSNFRTNLQRPRLSAAVWQLPIGRTPIRFASDAVFNDLTIFGVGTPVGNFALGETSLRRIGIGYIFADWIPQIIYTTPNWNGFTASGGIFTKQVRSAQILSNPGL